MSTVLAGPLAHRGRGLSLTGAAPWQALTLAFIAAGVAIGLSVPVPDISWLLIAGERALHGQRLYSQVLEVNPPMSVLLYEPAVLLADWLGLRPEAVVTGLCAVAIVASLGLAGAILKPLLGGDAVRGWRLAAAGAFAIGLLPGATFGQREHIAVMALLPFVALTIARAEGRPPPWILSVVAGLGFGAAACIKPHFAAIGALPALWALRRSGAFRPWALPELWAAALAFGGYLVLVLAGFPDYFTDVLPVLRDAYLPIRTPLWLVLILPAIPLALGGFAIARLLKLDGRWVAAPMLAALGGALAYVAQGKGWWYHAYPMLAFASLGLLGPAAAAPSSRTRAWSRLDRAMMLAPSLVTLCWLCTFRDPGPLARAVAAVAPPSPRVIAATGDLGLGIPLVPAIGARWLGSTHSDWIAEGAMAREADGGLAPAVTARLDNLIERDRERLARDMWAGHPDVILYDRKKFDWRAWALKDPEIAAEAAAFRRAGAVKGVEIWVRAPARPAGQASSPKP